MATQKTFSYSSETSSVMIDSPEFYVGPTNAILGQAQVFGDGGTWTADVNAVSSDGNSQVANPDTWVVFDSGTPYTGGSIVNNFLSYAPICFKFFRWHFLPTTGPSQVVWTCTTREDETYPAR